MQYNEEEFLRLKQENAALKQQLRNVQDSLDWTLGILHNKNMNRSDCQISAALVEVYPQILKHEEVAIDVRNVARKAKQSDSTVSKYLKAMHESEALRYEFVRETQVGETPTGEYTTTSKVTALTPFVLAPNRINTHDTPTRMKENEKKKVTQQAQAQALKILKCTNCGSLNILYTVKPVCGDCHFEHALQIIDNSQVIDIAPAPIPELDEDEEMTTPPMFQEKRQPAPAPIFGTPAPDRNCYVHKKIRAWIWTPEKHNGLGGWDCRSCLEESEQAS